MHPFPHRYQVSATGRGTGEIDLTSERLAALHSASPAEFDGPGDEWSPETLLVGSMAACFVLTFRAVASASKLSWISLDCDVAGTLDRVERVTQFTHFDVAARLAVACSEDVERAERVLEKAERSCLISNSLRAPVDLKATVEVAGLAAVAGRSSSGDAEPGVGDSAAAAA
jgi:peroxiredoxin-like protein